MTDYTELKRLAEAVLLPDWQVEVMPSGAHTVTSGQFFVAGGDDKGLYPDIAEFIAAANPTAVLALIAERDQIKAERDALLTDCRAYIEESDCGEWTTWATELRERAETLMGRIDAAMTKEQSE